MCTDVGHSNDPLDLALAETEARLEKTVDEGLEGGHVGKELGAVPRRLQETIMSYVWLCEEKKEKRTEMSGTDVVVTLAGEDEGASTSECYLASPQQGNTHATTASSCSGKWRKGWMRAPRRGSDERTFDETVGALREERKEEREVVLESNSWLPRVNRS